MIKVLMTLPVKIGFDGMSKQVLSYGKYMDKSQKRLVMLELKEMFFHPVWEMELKILLLKTEILISK